MLEAHAVGPRLLAARRATGLSRRAVEEASGVSARALEKLEAGTQEVSLARAVALCRLYGLPLARLTDADGGGLPAVYEPDRPGSTAAHELVGQLARILTGAPAIPAARGGAAADRRRVL